MYLRQCVLISIINQLKKEFQELHSFQDGLYKYVEYVKHNGMIGTDAYTQFKKHQNTKTAKTWQPRYLMNIMKATIIYQIIIFNSLLNLLMIFSRAQYTIKETG